jgi:hypothetical protein
MTRCKDELALAGEARPANTGEKPRPDAEGNARVCGNRRGHVAWRERWWRRNSAQPETRHGVLKG